MVAADHDRRGEFAGRHHVVEALAGLVALALAEPADPRRQALEVHLLLRQLDPAVQRLVLGEEVEDGLVGLGDVLRVAGERRPAEWALALAEQRPDVRGDEPGEGEGPVVARQPGLAADRVAVVEDLGAGVHEADHCLDVPGHRLARAPGELGRLGGRVVGHVLEGHAGREVAQRVVGTGLVGDDVDRRVHREQLREDVRGVAEQADGERLLPVAGLGGELQRVGEAGRLDVQVAVLDPARDAGRVAVHADRHAAVHRDGQRLGAAHAAETGGEGDGARQRPVELLVGDGGEGLVGALQDALGADVDPGPGGHLPVHGEPEALQSAELLPVGPVADQVGVGDQHARRPLVGLHHADRAAGLDQHGLVLLERPQGADHGVERAPVTGRLAGAAVDDQLGRVLGHLGVEVVHEHPQRGLLLPALGGQARPACGTHLARTTRLLLHHAGDLSADVFIQTSVV